MVQAGSYGAVPAEEPRRQVPAAATRSVAPKVAGMMGLALAAVVCVATLSDRMGSGAKVALEQTRLKASTAADFSVADAILDSSGIHDKKGSISASMAALAAQAAQEKETGQLVPTVSLPQIPKSIAKMAAEAKHEILIEQSVDKKTKARKAAAKVAAEKKLKAKTSAASAAAGKAAKQTAEAERTKSEVKAVQKAAAKRGGAAAKGVAHKTASAAAHHAKAAHAAAKAAHAAAKPAKK
uniref:Uncharacterized protein n=1 Tax=Hemiselmis tepida TaxID=464990 RepID=A0A7S0VQA9_9CRYP